MVRPRRLAWNSLSFASALFLSAASHASAQVAVVGELLVERTVEPGERYQGAITLSNTSDAVQSVTLRLADYRFDATGSNWFEAPGSNARSNSSWISLGQQVVSIPPGGRQVVPYTVSVPSGAAPVVGTYWSVVLVEADERRTTPSDPNGFTLTPRARYGVQVATHVIGEARECRLGFAEPRVQPGELSVDVSEAEVRACRPNYRLEVYDADGTRVHQATQRGSYLYPNTSARQRFALPPLTPGSYSFLLVADVGASRLQGARFQVQVR